jgi:putative membrane-bound dehydrogenase-like protein
MNNHVAASWLTLACFAFAAVPAAVCAQDSGSPQAAQPPKEIRQGGYVEKVEPGVDYKQRLPRIAPRDPNQSLEAFRVLPGFELQLVASEPLICDPVDIAFDEHGQMFVCELITYSERRATKLGRVSRLEDTDGDGHYDKSTVYVDGLEWPTGVLCFDGGIFVASSPDLVYCKDTNGDGTADIRETVITGFDTSNPNQCPNSLRWNLDNRVEMMPSGGGGLLEPVRWNRASPDNPAPNLQIRGRDLSVHPRTGHMRAESGGAQFGMTFDDWGNKFESSNSDPIEMVMYEDRYLARNPFFAAPPGRKPIWVDGMSVFRTSPVEPWRVVRTEMRVRGVFSGPVEGGGKPGGYFTSACGVMIYRGDAWPESFRGNAFVCEGAGNLVHRMRLDPAGIEYTAHRTESQSEFLTSDEIWFKPVQLHNAPDGTMYVVDMYREIYEHPDAVPPSVRKHVDLNAGNDRGRIYRLTPKGYHRPVESLAEFPSVALVSLLGHRNQWHWQTAFRLLYERQDPSAIAPLVDTAIEETVPLARMRAMYVLAGMHQLSEEVVGAGLRAVDPGVRRHAVRLAELLLADSPTLRSQICSLAHDQDVTVRRQVAFTLGDLATDRATDALVGIAQRDAGNGWVELAIFSSSFGRAGELFSKLAVNTSWRNTAPAIRLLEKLAEQAGLQNRRDQIVEIIAFLDTVPKEEEQLAQNVVRGLSRGLAKSKSPLLTTLKEQGQSRAGELLAAMIEQAKRTALDATKNEEQRAQAIRSLATADFDEARAVIAPLLDSRQPTGVQTAALRTLSRFTHADVPHLIVANWKGFSPTVRSEASEALFARQSRLGVLLKALEDKVIPTSQLDPARLQFLQSHPTPQIRQVAQHLLGGVSLARRDDAVEQYRAALEGNGDAAQGKLVFKRECAQCHKLEGVGYDLGLPLQNVKTRGGEGILIQILDPNREVNPSYLNYSVLTMDGQLITGVIQAETATSITLTRAEGESDIILRTDIDEMRSTDLSIMPEGLESKISPAEMADLLAYLLNVIE